MPGQDGICLDGARYRREKGGVRLEQAPDLEEIRIPELVCGEPVRWAAAYAFARTAAVRVCLPGSMEQIGNYAFYRCFQLRELVFSDALTDVGSGAFNGCRLERLEIRFRDGMRSALKFILDEQRYALDVRLVFRGEGDAGEARVFFPEHFEEAVENTPARILETHYHGSGGDYRQCFYNRNWILRPMTGFSRGRWPRRARRTQPGWQPCGSGGPAGCRRGRRSSMKPM